MGVIFKNNVMYGAGDIEISPVCYSEEEHEVGVWIDGKPLYQKTLYLGTITKDTNWHQSPHGIDNIDVVVSCKGFMAEYNNTVFAPIPNYRPGYSMGICIEVDQTNIEYMQNWIDSPSDQTYVTLQYTKTTDQPGSGKYAPSGVPAVHYSENEQVVGTWIDGSTLYEITVHTGALSTGDVYKAHEISNFGELIYAGGNLIWAGKKSTFPLTSRNSINWNITVADVGSTNIAFEVGSNYTGTYSITDSYTTLRYTKSTS